MEQALDGALEGALDLENAIRCVVALGYRIPCRRPMSALLGCHWQWRLWSRVARGVVPMGEQGSHFAGGGFQLPFSAALWSELFAIGYTNALGYKVPCGRPMSALLGWHWQWRL